MGDFIANARVWLTLKWAWLTEPGFRSLRRSAAILDRWGMYLRVEVEAAGLGWREPHSSLLEDGDSYMLWVNDGRRLELHFFDNIVMWIRLGPDRADVAHGNIVTAAEFVPLWRWLKGAS